MSVMEDFAQIIESLSERATCYLKTNIEFVKLNVIDKTSDLVSSLIPHTVVFVLVLCFLFFLNLSLALWLGEMLGDLSLGFFIVALFYGITGLFVRLFLHKRMKKVIGDYIVKQMLK
jgi:hypothetical protein